MLKRVLHAPGAHSSWPFGQKIGHGDPAYFLAVDVNGGFFTRPVIDSASVVPDGPVGIGVHLDPTIAEVDDPVDGNPARSVPLFSHTLVITDSCIPHLDDLVEVSGPGARRRSAARVPRTIARSGSGSS